MSALEDICLLHLCDGNSIKWCLCTSLPNSSLSAVMWLEIGHVRSICSKEMGKCYKFELGLLFYWLSRLNNIIEKILIIWLNLNMSACSYWIGNRKNNSEEIFFQYMKTIVWFSKEVAHVIGMTFWDNIYLYLFHFHLTP